VVLSQAKNDPTIHLHLDHEQEYMDDDDIIGPYTVSDDVCNTIMSRLVGQLVEKGQVIAQK
jgi:hypothetical protein